MSQHHRHNHSHLTPVIREAFKAQLLRISKQPQQIPNDIQQRLLSAKETPDWSIMPYLLPRLALMGSTASLLVIVLLNLMSLELSQQFLDQQFMVASESVLSASLSWDESLL